ncbi:MAG: Y-family DNA polymerase [Chloroflexota bacterium]
MDTPHRIIHLDLDAFYCAVEEQRDPRLQGKTFAVGGRPDERGVVASCSYAARARGVRSAMPMRTALGLCPGLLIVPPHFDAYHRTSHQVMERLRALTSQVEQVSIDEAFLDVSDLPEPVDVLAHRLQDTIRRDLGLPCSLGVASNKLVAKIATDVGKMNAANPLPSPPEKRPAGPPNAITIVPPGEEAAFLAPLPVQMLWGVGPKTAEKLAALHIETIGDLARYSEADLLRRFGKNGHDLSLHARGYDKRPVVTEHETKSISQETTFTRDVIDARKLHETLRQQAQEVARTLQRQNLTARTVKVKLRWADFTTLTRQVTSGSAFDDAETIATQAVKLFEKEWQASAYRAVRLIGIGVSGFDEPPQQLGLWDCDWQQDERLRGVIDDLQKRFGSKAFTRGLKR